MKTSTIAILSLLFFMGLAVQKPAHARISDRMESAKEKMEEKKTEREEKMEARRDEVCDKIEERIAEKITNFDNSHKLHIRQYELMKEKIGKVILEQGAKGKNVDKLKEDLATLNSKIDTFNADRVSLLDALKNIQQHTCGESDGSFKDAVTAAQAKHKIVISDAKDIRNFYQSSIRPDLKALRD